MFFVRTVVLKIDQTVFYKNLNINLKYQNTQFS